MLRLIPPDRSFVAASARRPNRGASAPRPGNAPSPAAKLVRAPDGPQRLLPGAAWTPPPAWASAFALCLVAAVAGGASAATITPPVPPTAGTTVKAPMLCNHGDRSQTFAAVVSMPVSRPVGATFKVRIDSLPSEKLSHAGLEYIHNMTTDYLLPPRATYVEGSAQVVSGTGTPNALPGATVTHTGRTVRLFLPAHIANGSSYTPPSIEFGLRATGPAGTALALEFLHSEVTAHAIVVGDIKTTCDPTPPPPTLGVTRVVR